MAVPLLATKLFVPPACPELVPRPRLTELLNAGLDVEGLQESGFARRLSLVSAPAGFGKTTLVATWLRGLDYAHAWLTLGESDNDPASFFAHFVAALLGVDANIGRTAQAMLQAPQPPAPGALFTNLINDIAASPRSFVLVLDDYHLIRSQSIHQQLAFLMEHQPPQMHLVIATREDPPLPLSRLRVRGQLAEIRQADLRFTPEESAEFLQRVTQVDLAMGDVEALHRRTEGWIAGLQLLALSLRDREDASSFVRSFTGSNRYVLDYLIEEVFQQQPAGIQDFLLRTSILERLVAPLCDALTGRDDGQKVLLDLEHANLFLVPLDESRQWYRYHRLFADLLSHRLDLEPAQERVQLHKQACRWFADNGFSADAVRHALAASDWEEAASLILQVSDTMLKRGEVVTLLGWFQALPEAFVLANPPICLGYAWPLILSEQVDAANVYLDRAEQAFLESGDRAPLGEIVIARIHIARVRGDGDQVIALSNQALPLLSPDHLSERSVVAVNLGLAQWYRGRLTEAEQALSDAEHAGRSSQNEYARWAASVFLGRIQAAQGRLRDAAESCRQIIRHGGQSPTVCLAHYDLGRLLYEWNDLEAAAGHVRQGIELARSGGNIEFESGGSSTLALIHQARGETSAALAALQRADRLAEHPGLPPPTRMSNLATQVAVALGMGDLDGASRAVERFPATPEEAGSFPDYLRLMLVRARLLLAQGQRQAGAEQLAALHTMASRAGWQYSAIQSCVLLALAAHAPEEPLVLLAEVVAQAEPEGYVRTFVDLGEPMAELLREAVSQGISPDYGTHLIAAFEGEVGGEEPTTEPPSTVTVPSSPALEETGELVEPLSDRELEVLCLLASGLTYREIAQALYLSVNTVKTHLKNVYGKLGVSRRREATAKARDLGLIP
jgi:LuxR family maltose regulon positive regulatory protein